MSYTFTSNLPPMSLNSLTKIELLTKCAELGIDKCKSKTKGELIELILSKEAKEEKPIMSLDDHHNPYTLVDLFCGTGAFSHAFHKTGRATTVFGNPRTMLLF